MLQNHSPQIALLAIKNKNNKKSKLRLILTLLTSNETLILFIEQEFFENMS